MVFDIIRHLLHLSNTVSSAKTFTVMASASVVDLLMTDNASMLHDLKNLVKKDIQLKIVADYHQERFEIAID